MKKFKVVYRRPGEPQGHELAGDAFIVDADSEESAKKIVRKMLKDPNRWDLHGCQVSYAIERTSAMNWRELFGSKELPTLLNEGIADETEGKEYWETMRDRFQDSDMPAASTKAGEFAGQEQHHHDLLKDVKRTMPGRNQRA